MYLLVFLFFYSNVQAPADANQNWLACLISATLTQALDADRKDFADEHKDGLWATLDGRKPDPLPADLITMEEEGGEEEEEVKVKEETKDAGEVKVKVEEEEDTQSTVFRFGAQTFPSWFGDYEGSGPNGSEGTFQFTSFAGSTSSSGLSYPIKREPSRGNLAGPLDSYAPHSGARRL